YVSAHRANVLGPAVAAHLREGAIRQLAAALDALAEEGARQPEDLADLLAIRTRLPWYFGTEQARMDGEVRSLMPFAQPGVLDAVMCLPLLMRRRGSLAKRRVRKYEPVLAHLPLAKGNLEMPFWAPRELTWVASQTRARMSRSVRRTFRDAFLDHVQSY